MSAVSLPPDSRYSELEETAHLLASGFKVLLAEVESLSHRERCLKTKLDFAHDEYRKLVLNPTLIANDPSNPRDVLRKIEVHDGSPTPIDASSGSLDHIAAKYDVKEALDACRILKRKLRRWGSPQQQGGALAKHTMDREDFEHDFTTRNGKRSNLECPFANSTSDGLPKESVDPIAAEFHADGSVGSGTAYAQQNPNKCPIRYLDQHSPEEVAKYFENHKHEIPRSHAVCISRYQQNEAKIRQLDAKYGNLQNLLQSLGIKHQQYLPAKDGEENVRRGSDQRAAVAVDEWAENVDGKVDDHIPTPVRSTENGVEGEEHGPHTQHFEKPLREIRLGESPSRPWGISVPLAQEATASVIPSDRGIEPLCLERSENGSTQAAKEPGKKDQGAERCPFDHGAKNKDHSEGVPEDQSLAGGQARMKDTPHQTRPQTIFNGPVFFGYTPEQVAALMRSGAFTSGQAGQ